MYYRIKWNDYFWKESILNDIKRRQKLGKLLAALKRVTIGLRMSHIVRKRVEAGFNVLLLRNKRVAFVYTGTLMQTTGSLPSDDECVVLRPSPSIMSMTNFEQARGGKFNCNIRKRGIILMTGVKMS